ncbi:MAG: hypothetical protein ACYCXT_01085 [Acidiferrobacteraceae bacterium]
MMGRTAAELEALTTTWTEIAKGQIVEDTVSYRAAVRILVDRLAQIVRPGQAIQPYVHAMLAQGYRRATAYRVVRAAFAIAAERVIHEGSRPKTVRTVAPDRPPDTAVTSVTAVPAPPAPAVTPVRPPASRSPTTAEAVHPERMAHRPQARAARPARRADPAYYGVHGQPAFGAVPWRYFQEDPKRPQYPAAAYPMTDAGVPVLDRENWIAPFGVDDAGTPLAPYGVTHRFGYPVQRTGVPPGSSLPSPKVRATGEEGWDDW